MMPVVASAASARFTWNAPRRIRNSPTKPLSPGSPTDDSTVSRNTAENRSSDYILSSEGIARATIRTIPSDKPAVQPTWLPFVRVLHLDKSVARAKQLGGKVLVSARPDLMNGKVAVIADPTGGAVGLLEWNPQ